MATKYVVCEQGFEYNDGGYDPAGIESLVAMYNSDAEALKKAQELAKKRFKQLEDDDWHSYLNISFIAEQHPSILSYNENVIVHNYDALVEKYWTVFYDVLSVEAGD